MSHRASNECPMSLNMQRKYVYFSYGNCFSFALVFVSWSLGAIQQIIDWGLRQQKLFLTDLEAEVPGQGASEYLCEGVKLLILCMAL